MQVSIYRRGRIWWVRYQQSGRKVRRSLGTTNRKIAEDLRVELEWRLHRGEGAAPPRRVLNEAFLEEYRAFSLSRKRPKSHATDMARIEAFLATLPVSRLDEVMPADVSRFLSQRFWQTAFPRRRCFDIGKTSTPSSLMPGAWATSA